MELKEGYIICGNTQKQKLLKNLREFKEYIFLSIEELRHKLQFQVKKGAVFSLMKKYNFSYSLALEYLRLVYFIEDKQYNEPKLDSIVSVYRFLKENHLLEKDTLFPIRLKQYPVTFIDIEPSKENLWLIEQVKTYTEVVQISMPRKKHIPEIYEFHTLTEEGLFVLERINDLVKKGVSLNKIFIFNADDRYLSLFRRLSKSYEIPMNFPSVRGILGSFTVKEFLKGCENQSNFLNILSTLPNDLYRELIVDVLNKYELNGYSPKECIEGLKSIFKAQVYPNYSYATAVNFVEGDYFLDEDEYGFYVNFNLGSAPVVLREEGFLNARELANLSLSDTMMKNELSKKRLENLLFSCPNLCFTYKCFDNTESFLPSLLIKEHSLPVREYEARFGISKLEDNLRLFSDYDRYLKYGDMTENLKNYGLNGCDYKNYSHKYKPLSREIMDKHFQDKPLKLAYSNIKLYFACPFSYYADRILGLNEFKPQMAARLGTFSHAVLEDSYQSDFDFTESVARNHLEYCEDMRDDFFFTQMEEVLRELISFNRLYEARSCLKDIKREEHIIVTKEGYTFEGFIDKMLYTIIDKDVYVAIIDYKTGKDIVSLDNIEDGFHLQLPSYMYLLKEYEPFKHLNLHIIGIYLQKVNIVIFDNKSSITSQRNKQFMLEGYTVALGNLIEMLDPEYTSSTYIKSMGTTKDGFRSYAKLFHPSQQEKIISLVDKLISHSASEIHKGNFEIAPKVIRGKNESCTFCKYKDICFCDYEDEVILPHKPFRREEE